MEIVGRISKTFGLGGELTVSLFDTFPVDFNLKEPLFVVVDDLAVPLFCDSFSRRGRSGAVVIFSDINTCRRAEEFIGKKLYMPLEAEIDDSDEDDGLIYLEDLVGYSADMGKITGRIEAFIDGENPLFRIDAAGTEIYIPAVEEFMADINANKKQITFDLPNGLLDLYLSE